MGVIQIVALCSSALEILVRIASRRQAIVKYR